MEDVNLPSLPEQNGIEFRHVQGWPGYCVGTDGSVWSCRIKVSRGLGNGSGPRGAVGNSWHRLRQADQGGYCVVELCCDGKSHQEKVHRLVLFAFVGPCPFGMCACHYDDNRQNNALLNLRWDLPRNNSADMVRNGTQARGEKNGMAKFVEEDVRQIRRLLLAGEKQVDVARRWGVDKLVISRIARRVTWRHVQ